MILSVTQLDPDLLDNSGFSCTAKFPHLAKIRIQSLQELSTLPPRDVESSSVILSHRSLTALENAEIVSSRIPQILRSRDVNLIDTNGDTPLAAILKEWKEENEAPYLEDAVKTLVDSGAEIHMRDRDGNAAIALAAVRGFRPTLNFLLGAGANIHSRDYKGTGILSQVEDAMDKASFEEDDGLYAKLLSCFSLLVDAGAIVNPTVEDEWMLPSARALVAERAARGHIEDP